ncbi:MAG: hypothetical protein BGO78_16830 [Chloroflexi bacterium 44-23]|nr:MAG: hypothetical protein BGO78_16830 [Chloroflexi bacterium 44-23]
MIDIAENDLEITPKSIVLKSARDFTQKLTETPQYVEFIKAHIEFRGDTEAQQIQQNYQKKQAALRAVLMLNAASEEERLELLVLQEQFNKRPSVIRYINAQSDFIVVCQEIGDLLSKELGIDFAAACKTGGCCG